jgi:mevalonate kinase
MKKFYSNGKLLLTGEYFVLDGTKALAVPTTYGQDLTVKLINGSQLIWNSYTNKEKCWLEVVLDLPKLRLHSATFESSENNGKDKLAEDLVEILLQIRKLNPSFLNSEKGISIKTNLTFPKNWGLGSSSTLINNLANWGKVNPYELLQNTFGGSGYDIACAQNDTPILYIRNEIEPIIEQVEFNPEFKNQLYFVYLNQKQNSRVGIELYQKFCKGLTTQFSDISALSDAFITCKNLKDFEKIFIEHEQIVSKTIRTKRVQEQLFSDYFGQTKSLGAWGGDFILATGNDDTPKYFREKGFLTVIPYKEMVLNKDE